MKIPFTKMQGLGNDFVVLNNINGELRLDAELIKQLADRHFGVGCDQVLVVESTHLPGVDFRYRIFNADGNEVEQCGNGARCFVRFVHDMGLTTKTEISVETAGGLITPRLEKDGSVTVNMGSPRFEPHEIPFIAEQRALTYMLDVSGEKLEISAISMGNPHAVQIVADLARAPVLAQGSKIEQHVRFPQRVNAGFMQIIDRGHISLRVYERGVGETLACGTGACAAVVAGIMRGLLDYKVVVTTRGGKLTILWQGDGSPVLMNGPAMVVFTGEFHL